MKCLVVGGTGFLGGAITDALLDDGHEVFTLSRGQTVRPRLDSATAIYTDRFGDLLTLKAYEFDWVFDTCAFEPEAVENLLKVVGESCRHYALISSISVYGRYDQAGIDETNPVATATDEDLALVANLLPEQRGSAESYGASYGRLKRACEIKADEMIGSKAIAHRVGLLVGAGDYMDRLTWWVRRIDTGIGPRRIIPAPAPPNRPLQIIDVRDVADFTLKCASASASGTWNVTGPTGTLSDVLSAIIKCSQSDATIQWVDENAITSLGISPWTDIPLMAPTHPDFRYFLDVSVNKALRQGLKTRSLTETIKSLLEWDRSRRDHPLKGGMSEDQEAMLLNAAR